MKREKSEKNTAARRFASAQEVAKKAGVSRSAVSRAFTPGASIAPETRDKVMQAALELGYHVNDLARGLLANRSRLVGLVVTKPEVGFRAHLVSALTRALVLRGSVPLVINTGSLEQELHAAQAALFGYRAEATIILSGSPPATFVDLARRNGQPLIMIGRAETDCDHVRIDNSGAARMAARILVERGHRHLALAGVARATPSLAEREEAFTGEARALGMTVAAAHERDATYAGGQAAADALFDRLDRGDRPDAVFCVNDLMAIGLIDRARNRYGLRIPDDVAVIGFDDIPEAAWDAYRLTTFRQDPEKMAEAAVAHLERRLADPDAPPGLLRLEAAFIERGTTRSR
ncbi:LacI family DNA-binding transcriptional regulator [Stappia sp.]|uniref:LacI family DNA-binding transcriptional regulator n=1 Tax=Stappia sp. TaxID=1870903 RepID=UPI003A996B03